MFFNIFCIISIAYAVIGAPINENQILKKRDVNGASFPLTEIISRVEDSLIKAAIGSLQDSTDTKRSGRQIKASNTNEESPITQLSVLTVKFNSQNDSQKNLKNTIQTDLENKIKHQAQKLNSNLSISKETSTDKLNYPEEISTKQKLIESKNVSKEIDENISREDFKEKTSHEQGIKSDKINKNKTKNQSEEVSLKKVAEIEVNPVILASRV